MTTTTLNNLDIMTVSGLVEQYYRGWNLIVEDELLNIDFVGDFNIGGDYNHSLLAKYNLSNTYNDFQVTVYNSTKTIDIHF